MVELAKAPERASPVRRRRLFWVLAACAVAVLGAAAPTTVWFVHWRASLRPLIEYPGYGVGTPLRAGHTLYFGDNVVAARILNHPHESGELSLNISAARPVVVENTAGASVSVVRCVLASNGDGPEGQGPLETRQQCSSLSPFQSGPVTVGFSRGDDDILIAVTPAHSGVVRVHGMRVSFSSGWRHGTQHVGPEIRTRTL